MNIRERAVDHTGKCLVLAAHHIVAPDPIYDSKNGSQELEE